MERGHGPQAVKSTQPTPEDLDGLSFRNCTNFTVPTYISFWVSYSVCVLILGLVNSIALHKCIQGEAMVRQKHEYIHSDQPGPP
jgi:hypothetical protein